jgi:hypothetical protein
MYIYLVRPSSKKGKSGDFFPTVNSGPKFQTQIWWELEQVGEHTENRTF